MKALPCPRLLQVLAVLATCSLSATASAQAAKPPAASSSAEPNVDADQQVRDLTRAGIAQARANDLEAARTSFARAWELKPDTNLAVLLARIEMKLGRYREAAEHWEYYLQNVPPDPTTAAVKLAECRQHLGSVRVSGEPPGALVYVDGREVGKTPLASDVWLDPGEHTLHARLEERSSSEQKLKVVAGEVHNVTLVLSTPQAQPAPPPQADAAKSQAPPSQDEARTNPARTVVLVSGGVLTLGALVTGIAFTVRANSLARRMEDLQQVVDAQADPGQVEAGSSCSDAVAPPECAELAVTYDEHQTARNVAIAGYVSAGVLGVGTAMTYLLWPSQAQKSAQNRNFELTPLAGARGVQVRLRF